MKPKWFMQLSALKIWTYRIFNPKTCTWSIQIRNYSWIQNSIHFSTGCLFQWCHDLVWNWLKMLLVDVQNVHTIIKMKTYNVLKWVWVWKLLELTKWIKFYSRGLQIKIELVSLKDVKKQYVVSYHYKTL